MNAHKLWRWKIKGTAYLGPHRLRFDLCFPQKLLPLERGVHAEAFQGMGALRSAQRVTTDFNTISRLVRFGLRIGATNR